MAQLIARTRLKGEFAFDCLDNSGWNLEEAVKKFEQVKVRLRSSKPVIVPRFLGSDFIGVQGNLGPDAYLQF